MMMIIWKSDDREHTKSIKLLKEAVCLDSGCKLALELLGRMSDRMLLLFYIYR